MLLTDRQTVSTLHNTLPDGEMCRSSQQGPLLPSRVPFRRAVLSLVVAGFYSSPGTELCVCPCWISYPIPPAFLGPSELQPVLEQVAAPSMPCHLQTWQEGACFLQVIGKDMSQVRPLGYLLAACRWDSPWAWQSNQEFFTSAFPHSCTQWPPLDTRILWEADRQAALLKLR